MKSIGPLLPFFCITALTAQVPELSSSSVSEAVEQLVGRRAHMTNDIHLLAGARISGPAVTMRLVRDEKASGIAAGLAAIKLLEGSPAGSVVVAALDDDKAFAVFGSTFAALAKTRNLAGFVVDGSVRDLSDLKRLAFPTFARGTAAGSAGGHYRIDGANVAVQCGGIEVRPGDYVVADEDGIAVAPQERYPEVIAAAKEWQSDKQALLPLIEKYGSYLKAMQERDAAKRKQ
ncbi:MAG: RraA family protein [Bryobacteraceae bacterium]|jgi:regulator of RNase E activity RraA